MTKNPNTVIFKCINVVDRQRFDVTVINRCQGAKARDFAHLEHKFLVSGVFYEATDNRVVQVSKGGIFDLATAIRKKKINLNELTIRSLLYHMLSVLQYCQTAIAKPFQITIFDVLVFKEMNSTNPNDLKFKLKNCFLENQFDELDLRVRIVTRVASPNTTFFNDECVISAIVKLGNIVFDAIKNAYGYNAPLELVSNTTYSSSLRYVINCMVYYRAIKSPPSISELLLFFQTPGELYMEKLRSALFEGVKVTKKLFTEVNGDTRRSKSCFF